jgi:hypothetical protein
VTAPANGSLGAELQFANQITLLTRNRAQSHIRVPPMWHGPMTVTSLTVPAAVTIALACRTARVSFTRTGRWRTGRSATGELTVLASFIIE